MPTELKYPALSSDRDNRGIYVPDDDRWPEAFRGMAIQIEDSICVCEDGPLILSTEAVKEVRQSTVLPHGSRLIYRV